MYQCYSCIPRNAQASWMVVQWCDGKCRERTRMRFAHLSQSVDLSNGQLGKLPKNLIVLGNFVIACRACVREGEEGEGASEQLYVLP